MDAGSGLCFIATLILLSRVAVAEPNVSFGFLITKVHLNALIKMFSQPKVKQEEFILFFL